MNGTTACKWDSVIPFDEMWLRLNKLIKPNGAIVLFGSEPFSSALRMSNIKNYKYDWVWEKEMGTGFLNANRRPLKNIENVSVFNSTVYYPQKTDGKPYVRGLNKKTELYGKFEEKGNRVNEGTRYPKTTLYYNSVRKGLHPTQKPVSLMEYLIKTYTNENETVLDFTMGSGSTGVACVNTKRDFIGIELDDGYFNISQNRIKEAQSQGRLF